MSARKASSVETSPAKGLDPGGKQTHLTLASDAVLISKNGVEFRSPNPFPLWTEMTASIQAPSGGGEAVCTGIVVACTGNRHTGYCVSLLFSGLTPQTEEQLNTLARLSPA